MSPLKATMPLVLCAVLVGFVMMQRASLVATSTAATTLEGAASVPSDSTPRDPSRESTIAMDDNTTDVSSGNITESALAAAVEADTQLVGQFEGTGRVAPKQKGPCRCIAEDLTTDGAWTTDVNWQPNNESIEKDGTFMKPSEVASLIRSVHHKRATNSVVRILLVGDSITRYLMCFLAKSVALEMEGSELQGCEPEQSRGAHFLLWPSTAAERAKSPVLLQFISDFYFPESHVAQNLRLMEEEESQWMPSPDVIIVSRGTWDTWIRNPRATTGRYLYFGLSAGLLYLRKLYPQAEIISYGLSQQQPARYHKHSERCAMQTSMAQVRGLVYCGVRRANRLIHEQLGQVASPGYYTPIRYIDFGPMTWLDRNWYYHTMNNDGMHYVGPHAPWFAKYMWRLIGSTFELRRLRLGQPPTADDEKAHTAVERSTPSPIDAECEDPKTIEEQLPFNTMPHQRRMKNHPKAKGSKVKRDCGLWLQDRQALLDFHKSFTRLRRRNITRAIQFSDCVYFHKASCQRLGGVDPNWPSSHTEHMIQAAKHVSGSVSYRNSTLADDTTRLLFFKELADAVLLTQSRLWDRWKKNSLFCLDVERALTQFDMQDMNREIVEGAIPCGHRLVWALRASPMLRSQMDLPTLIAQNCSMVHGKRHL